MTSLQNNALIYADPTTPEEARQAEQWFALVAGRANAALEACGFAAGPVLAREAPWRRSIRQWQQAYRDWILKGEAPTLAAVAPYFDLRSVHGDPALVYQLEQDLQDVLNVHIAEAGQQFIRQLARQALKQRPPLSFFQRFALERDGAQRGTFNIRLGGTLPVVEAARALALDLRYFASTNTFDRLRHVADALPAFSDVAERTLAAYRYLVDSRLEHQLRAVEAGEQPSDHLHPDALSRSQRSRLRDAFLEVGRLQEGLAKGYNL